LHGQVIMGGLALCLAGIVVIGRAGRLKERDMSPAEQKVAIAEFDLKKGILVAIFSGITSACFAYGLAAGESVKALTLTAGTAPLWQGLPVLCLVLLGGATTNFIWCGILIFRNRTGGEFVGKAGIAADGAAPPPLLRNYLLCAVAGTMWYFQFFFYTMGESQMGKYGFSSWTLHMASIIIFGTCWGFAFKEWKDAEPRVRRMVWSGVGLLIFATLIIGYGNRLAG